jgi:hypothetical protein
LKDVIIRANESIGGSLVIDGAVNIFYDTLVVDWDRQWGRVGTSVVRLPGKECFDPCKSGIECRLLRAF